MRAVVDVARAEWFRVWRKRRVYVLAALYWVLLPSLALFVARTISRNVSGSFVDRAGGVDAALQALATPFGLARLMLTVPASMNPTFYVVCVTLFAAVLIGEERSLGMWKNVLAIQPTRWAVMAGKLIAAMLVAGVMLAGALVSGAAFGWAGSTFLRVAAGPGEWGSLLSLYLLQWSFLAAPTLLAFLLVYVVRSSALGVVLVLFLPSLLEGIYGVVNLLLGLRPLNALNAALQALNLTRAWEALPKYFFTANAYAPARAPTGELLFQLGGGTAGQAGVAQLLGWSPNLTHAALVSAAYAALFATVLFVVFARRDVD